MESGEYREESGEWRAESIERRAESGVRRRRTEWSPLRGERRNKNSLREFLIKLKMRFAALMRLMALVCTMSGGVNTPDSLRISSIHL